MPQAQAWNRSAFFSMASLPHLGTAARNQVMVRMTHHTLPAMVKKYSTMKRRVQAWGRGHGGSVPRTGSAEAASEHTESSYLVMGALGHGGGPEPAGTGCVTGHVVLQQEAQEEHQGHHHVAHRVEDDGALRVTEARHVDEEGEEGEEGGGQTDDGHHPDEIAGERQLLACKVHVGAGGGAVSDPQEGVAQLGVDFEFSGTPEAVVPLDGDGGVGGV